MADLCACLAETECKRTALNAATDGMTFAEEDDYLKRTDHIRTALYAEQQKLLRALTTVPVRSASDIVELARVTVLLTRMTSGGYRCWSTTSMAFSTAFCAALPLLR